MKRKFKPVHTVNFEDTDTHVWAYRDFQVKELQVMAKAESDHQASENVECVSDEDAKKIWAAADAIDEVLALPQAATLQELDARKDRVAMLKAEIETGKTLGGKKESTRKERGRSWWDEVGMYVVDFLRGGQYPTAKQLYSALHNAAGTDPSPFDKGIGAGRYSLFIRTTNKLLPLKTVTTNWKKIRTAAKEKL